MVFSKGKEYFMRLLFQICMCVEDYNVKYISHYESHVKSLKVIGLQNPKNLLTHISSLISHPAHSKYLSPSKFPCSSKKASPPHSGPCTCLKCPTSNYLHGWVLFITEVSAQMSSAWKVLPLTSLKQSQPLLHHSTLLYFLMPLTMPLFISMSVDCRSALRTRAT